MSYATSYDLLTRAERAKADSVTMLVEDSEIRFPVSEARYFWDNLAPGDDFQIISINFE